MTGRISDKQKIPKPNMLDRDAFVLDFEPIFLQETGEFKENMAPRVEQCRGNISHYFLGRIHVRPEVLRERPLWRGKALLAPRFSGLLVRQRETMGSFSEALQEWFGGLIEACEAGKYNPLETRAFIALLRTQPHQTVQIMDLSERSLRLELGMPA
jgi:hypothetical protein